MAIAMEAAQRTDRGSASAAQESIQLDAAAAQRIGKTHPDAAGLRRWLADIGYAFRPLGQQGASLIALHASGAVMIGRREIDMPFGVIARLEYSAATDKNFKPGKTTRNELEAGLAEMAKLL